MTDEAIIIVAAIAAAGSIVSASISGLALIAAQGTHRLINSRMTELLEHVRREARAEGRAEGVASERDT